MNQPGSTRRPIGGLSHVRGSTEVALCETTVYALLEQAARRWPQRDAAVFVEQGIRWTWAELREQVDRAAAGFARLGVVKGERVGIWSPNRFEWVVTQLATARMGAVLVNINPAYKTAELKYVLLQSGIGTGRRRRPKARPR